MNEGVFNMSTDKKLPKYRQIIDYMKEKIEYGEWPIGSKVLASGSWRNYFM